LQNFFIAPRINTTQQTQTIKNTQIKSLSTSHETWWQQHVSMIYVTFSTFGNQTIKKLKIKV